MGATGIGLLLPLSESPVIQLATHPLTLEFAAGCLIARIYFLGKFFSGWPFLVLALVWWLAGYGIHIELGYGLEPIGLWCVLLFGTPATLSVFALSNIERVTGRIPPGWIVLIGDAAFSIYLSHILVISTFGRIWEGLAIAGSGVNIIALLIMLLIALTIGIASYQLLERPLLRFTRHFEEVVIRIKNNRSP